MAREKEPPLPPIVPGLGKEFMSKIRESPPEMWREIPSQADIRKGMIIRNKHSPDNPTFYFYVLDTTPDERGFIEVVVIDGSRKTAVLKSVIPARYHQYVGPLPASVPDTIEPSALPVEAPPELSVEDLNRRAERASVIISKTPSKKSRKGSSKTEAAAKSLDEARVEEETKLLRTACLALAYAFGTQAPEACDTEYATIVSQVAERVVRGEITHEQAVNEIVATIRKDQQAPPKSTQSKKKSSPSKTPPQPAQVPGLQEEIQRLDARLDEMATKLEDFFRRWEVVSPAIPTSEIKFVKSQKRQSVAAKGGDIGYASYKTGQLQVVPLPPEAELPTEKALYVKDGLCLHFTKEVAYQVHTLIAEALDTTPDRLFGFDVASGTCYYDPSNEPGYDYSRCFDLTRPRLGVPFRAAGGRIASPSSFIQAVLKAVPEGVKIAVAEKAVLA